jgi:hypothetical protein
MMRLGCAALPVGMALMAFVSLQPYFLWRYQKPAYGLATLIVVTGAAVGWRAFSIDRSRIALSVAFALFLVYLSFLPRLDGPPTRWFLLIPFTIALVHCRRRELAAAFDLFLWLFALSVLPAMALWLWLVLGLPLEMQYAMPPAEIAHNDAKDYAQLPGAIFLLGNGVVLPNGGTLFRLCGIYDEPGTVGTVAALCLAATRFRFDARGLICFFAGLMSFSIAFAVLATLGLIATAARPWRALAAVGVIVAASIPLSGLKSDASAVSNLIVNAPAEYKVESALFIHSNDDTSIVGRQRFEPAPGSGLRNSPLDNRSGPAMRRLLEEYQAAPIETQLFGVASDASIVIGGGSSVWYRLLTDFGAIGFALALAAFAFPLAALWQRSRIDAGAWVFVILFLMSFYQRPIIWLSAPLLIYLVGIRWAAIDDERGRAGRRSRLPCDRVLR